MRKTVIAFAALAASIATFSFSSAVPARAGQQIACPAHAIQNGRCYYNARRVVGYRVVEVRRPVYHTVRRACPTTGCAPIAAPQHAVIQTPAPRVVDVPQRIIVRPVPQVTYMPPAQVRIAPAPCPAPTATRAPCDTCGAAAATQIASAHSVGGPCTGERSGRPGVWKIDPSNGRLGCWVGN